MPGRPRTGRMLVATALTAAVVGAAAGLGGGYLGAHLPPQMPIAGTANQRPPVPAAPDNADIPKVAERMLPSTVTIYFRSGSKGGTGSGFVLDKTGHIMTNNHVVEGAASGGEIRVQFDDNSRRTAHIVGRSPSYDLAVIKVDPDQKLIPVDIGDSEAAKPGQTAIAVGSPLGLGSSVTAGIVSAKDRPLQVGGAATGLGDADAYINGIQTDAPINPGNSGGPLADAGGRVIGVNSAILTLGGSVTNAERQGNIGVGFAIPINQAMIIGDQLIKTGKAVYPVLGAEVADDDAGVRVTRLTPGGPAERAGLRPGDVVTAVNGRPVFEQVDLVVRIRTFKPGDQVTVAVLNRGDLKVTLGSREG